MKQILMLLATFFYTGYLPIAPGTWASLVTTLLVYFIKPYREAPFYFQIPVIVLIFIIGLPAAGAAEKHFDKKDPRKCVIDEVAGQMVSLLFIPYNVYFYAAAFFLFRFFDILKPFPVKRAERIPGGLGIMLDDILAGLYALAVLQLYRYLF
jgi:phosphatidylglycerophosphatase A